jgi:hypothetical protein
MKIWILLVIAGLLLLWGLSREGFAETSTIKSPPYFEGEVARIYLMLSEPSQEILMEKARLEKPNMTDETTLAAIAGGYVSPAVESFYTTVYAPAKKGLKAADVEKFMRTRTGEFKEIEKEAITEYFLNQAGPHSSGYDAILDEMGQNTSGTGGYAGAESVGATGATGASGTGATGTTSGTTAGGTTGGESVSSAAPNAGGARGRKVFGPVFTELGAPVDGGDGSDTSRTNRYPELLGGMGDTRSVRGPGGIRNPSQNWLLSQSGALPSTASLGSDQNSSFLPYSRVPGDQDVIPDPYRLSRNYSTASYSSKTDPVPFLTDFSAFLK